MSNTISFTTRPDHELAGAVYNGDCVRIPLNGAIVNQVRLTNLRVPKLPPFTQSTLGAFVEPGVYTKEEFAPVYSASFGDLGTVSPDATPLDNTWMTPDTQTNEQYASLHNGNIGPVVTWSDMGLDANAMNWYGWHATSDTVTSTGRIPRLRSRNLHVASNSSARFRLRWWDSGIQQPDAIIELESRQYTFNGFRSVLSNAIDAVADGVGVFHIPTKEFYVRSAGARKGQILPVDDTESGSWLANAIGFQRSPMTFAEISAGNDHVATRCLDLSSSMCVLSEALSGGSSAVAAETFREGDLRLSKYFVGEFNPDPNATNGGAFGPLGGKPDESIAIPWIVYDRPRKLDYVDIKFVWPHGPINALGRYITGDIEFT